MHEMELLFNITSMIINKTSNDAPFSDGEPHITLPKPLFYPFIIISIIESVLGIIGNSLVIIVISCIGKSNDLNRSYNCFIVNLALSDLVLCLFTMPLNTYRSLYIFMKFPPAFCKLADSFPAINVYVSSLTVVAISFYRYLAIYYPHKNVRDTLLTFVIIVSIWLLAIGAASPLFIYSLSTPAYDESIIDVMAKVRCENSHDHSCREKNYNKLKRLHVCHESWPIRGELRSLYTIFMVFLQFIFPLSIICITYYQVTIKLKERFRYRFLIKKHNTASLQSEIRRQRRNNILLLLIVAFYAISWLPFNTSYMIFTYANRYSNNTSDYSTNRKGNLSKLSKYLPLRFLICMISAIANPFLYGCFNETFKDGLQKIYSICCRSMNTNVNSMCYNERNNQSMTNKSKQNNKKSKSLREYSDKSHLNSPIIRFQNIDKK